MKKQRDVIRVIHLIGAAAIGTYVYSPFSEVEWFKLTMQIIVIPALALTGIWLWKPKWFKKNKKNNLIALVILMLATLNTGQAQDKVVGGAGGFMLGFKTQHTSAFQYFVNENGPQLSNHLIQIGGEGYGLIKNWVIGGGGYHNTGDQKISGSEAYQVDGGGGYINVGYVVFNASDLLVFPLLGLGIDALGVEKRVNEDVFFELDSFLFKLL